MEQKDQRRQIRFYDEIITLSALIFAITSHAVGEHTNVKSNRGNSWTCQ